MRYTKMAQWAMVLVALTIPACRSNDGAAPGGDGGGSVSGCERASAEATPFDVPAGVYEGTISASDTRDCGDFSPAQTEDHLIEVAVTYASITLQPGKPAEVSIVRQDNSLCGRSRREFRLDDQSNLCILDETDTINGEVTADGEFWVDLDFDWTRKGGVCNSLTLPCSGRTTWSFSRHVFALEGGTYDLTIKEVTENTCDAPAPAVGQSWSSEVSVTKYTLRHCPSYATECETLRRDSNRLSHSGPFDWGQPKCAGSVEVTGSITSATKLTLTWSFKTDSSCSEACRLVYVEELERR